jgi:hypothetical protein
MALGAGFFLSARTLDFGTSLRMGPGYFPTILSGILFALGAATTFFALRGRQTEGAFGTIAWRPVLLVVGSSVLFGLTMRGLGLGPVLILVVLLAASASRYARLRTALPLALGIAAFCALLFIEGLGLPLPLIGPWLSPDFWWPAASIPAQ